MRIMLIGSALIVLLSIGIGLTVYPTIKQMDSQIQQIVRDHQDLKVSHPGWSFPGLLYSAPAPLSLDKGHRIAHAKIRNYTNQCPAIDSGTYCVKDGSVIPRGGVFPEGIQPSGLKGWTRDLAMEPIELGPLIGPDAEIRYHLPLEKAPSHLIAALLHSEDADFYKHSGVNFFAFARAVIANLQGGGYAQGASTITMQVVRNLTQDKDKNIKRKLREVAFSLLMERHFSKDEILQLYLDMPYLGQDGSFSICGFAAASRFYFQKDVADITINEAAILVGILPAPATYRPDKFPARAQKKTRPRSAFVGTSRMECFQRTRQFHSNRFDFSARTLSISSICTSHSLLARRSFGNPNLILNWITSFYQC